MKSVTSTHPSIATIIIEVTSKIMKLRDVYTSDHQKSSAELSRKIAQALSLKSEDVDHIFIAACVHDIGKISVPAEILSKPSTLTNEEYALVKKHVQYGYDALRNSTLSEQVLSAMYQHHERLDGSGYPKGLKGSDISMGAKIIAVADTVDSMMRHRPYRPALGLDATLVEILSHKSVLYDSEVVDACFTLLTEERKLTAV